MKSLLLALRAKLFFARHVIFATIYHIFPRLSREGFFWCACIFYARSRVKNARTPKIISQDSDLLNRGCVKSLLPPSAAKYYFERHVIFMISLREIMKMTCLSKDNSARSAVKTLFTQPLAKECSAAAGGKILFAQLRRSRGYPW